MTERLRISHTIAEAAFKLLGQKRYRKTAQVWAIQIESDFEIETREGWLKADKGDYLVVNVIEALHFGQNQVSYPWPVRKEIFESTYEEVKG
jgi:hypothetical protein